MIVARIRHARHRVRVEAVRARRRRERLRYELTYIDRRRLLGLSAVAAFVFLGAFAIARATSGSGVPTAGTTSLNLSAVSVNASIPASPDIAPSIADLVVPLPQKRSSQSSRKAASTPSSKSFEVTHSTGPSTVAAPLPSSATPVSTSPSSGGSTPQHGSSGSHPSTGNGGGSFDSSG